MRDKYVITITRQFGSMGRPIAKLLAEKLGIHYYDREAVDEIAKKAGLVTSAVDDIKERESRYEKMKYPAGSGDSAAQQEIFEVQKQIIQDLAQRESCIIVGRCSDYILKDFSNALHIYIYASKEQRYLNCLELLKMYPGEARAVIRDVDKARLKYHKTFAGYAPDDVRYKDLMINSGSLGIHGTADALESIIRTKFNLKNGRY